MRSLWKTLVDLIRVMPKGAGPFYAWYSVLTSLLALLDTAALALIVVTVPNLLSGNRIEIPVIGEIPAHATVWVAVAVCALFILKGVLALTLHWIATRRFARYELEIGDRLFQRYMRSSWEQRSQLSTAEVTRLADTAIANANMGFVIPLSQIPGNAFTFIAMLAVLVVAQPGTAAVALAYLGLVSLIMMLAVTRKGRLAGQHNRIYSYRVATIMTEMVDALKEVTLRNKLDEVGRVISTNRVVATRARANISFLGIVPKYVLEAALIGGFLLVGAAAYIMGGDDGPAAAATAVALFAASGFRMIPAMTSVQGALTTASSNEISARDVITALRDYDVDEYSEAVDRGQLPVTPQELRLEGVSFRYPGAERDVLQGLNLSIPMGSTLAVVGPSGAGKSTLIDILLGLSRPTAGSMRIDDVELSDVMAQWRRRVGYVPQRVALFDASIAQNVALTWEDDFDEAQVERALERAHLGDLMRRGRGIQESIGERGQSISGGQQQRLGIARALYSDPLVMVMDEATSALDTETEARVTESMRELQGDVTFITVAHRLATIRDYDQICYLDSGRILGSGTFEEVIAQVPEFRVQAQLAGLTS